MIRMKYNKCFNNSFFKIFVIKFIKIIKININNKNKKIYNFLLTK